MRYLIIVLTFFAFPAFAEEYNDINEKIRAVCDKTVLSCDDDENILSHGAINHRIERASAVSMATDFHRADEQQDNHLVLNVANFDFANHATAFGVGYLRDFTGGWSAGLSFATDVTAHDQAVKATVGFSW